MRTRRSWLAIAAVVVTVPALLGAGCGDDDNGGGGNTSGPSGAAVPSDIPTLQPGKLKVGSNIPNKPFEFGAPPYQGFDVDMVNEIGKRLKLAPEFVKTPFDPIFRDLAQGKFDMVASAASITPQRKKTIDFSYPYFVADQSLMVKRGTDIGGVGELAGKVVGAQLGSTGAAFAKQSKAKEVRTYRRVNDLFKALDAGKVDAVINDFPVSKYAEREFTDLVVVDMIATGEEYGFAFKKGNTKLRDAVNREIDAIKKDGTYTALYAKWIRAEPPENILKPGTAGSNATGTEPVR